MKYIRKLRKQSKSEYVLSIPVKIIKKFEWDGKYLEITESKNSIQIKNIEDNNTKNTVEKKKPYDLGDTIHR